MGKHTAVFTSIEESHCTFKKWLTYELASFAVRPKSHPALQSRQEPVVRRGRRVLAFLSNSGAGILAKSLKVSDLEFVHSDCMHDLAPAEPFQRADHGFDGNGKVRCHVGSRHLKVDMRAI